MQDVADLAPIDQHLEKEHQEKTKVKNIQSVEMGRYEVRRNSMYLPGYPSAPGPEGKSLVCCMSCMAFVTGWDLTSILEGLAAKSLAGRPSHADALL